MKQILIFALLLSVGKKIYSQEIKIDSILTEKQNAEWIEQFDKLDSKSEQIAEIKKKIYTDSLFTTKNAQNRKKRKIIIKELDNFEEASGKASCECKIIFVLYFEKGSHFLDPIEFPKTNEILELITEKSIDIISIIKGYNGTALYGSLGKCGVVLMNSNNRKLKRKLKNVL